MTEEEEEPRDLYVGRLVDGRYRVTRCIGAGGMGSVYEATQDDMGRTVALKILHVQLAKDPGVLRRFRNEARASVTLGHPAIARAYDFGRTEDGAPFIAMELLDGRDLGKIIEAEGPLAFERTVAIADQLADALGAAHAAGIVHRDVKPENILLLDGEPDREDAVKVLDFGISKFADGQASVATRTGSFLGSPTYMAPEQVQDASRADARTDVYALGAVLYTMLAGQPMFSCSSLPMLIMAIANDPPQPLGTLRPDTPSSLLALVERMTHKDATRRPQTMAEVREALAAIDLLDAAPSGAEPPVPVEEPVPIEEPPAPRAELAQSRIELPVSRRPALAIAAVIGALLVATVAVYLGSRDAVAEPSGEPTTGPQPTTPQPTTVAEPVVGPRAPEPPTVPLGVDPTEVDDAPGVEPSPDPLPVPRRRRRRRAAPREPHAEDPSPTEIDGVPIDDSY